ncbi:glycosyltransferase family 2 protein [Aeromonas sp. R6-1]|uniref:glycosyltransferase family 2 protein n=1 Tax=Aeromonas sp. R6-1 TaxID=3138471 RepID=UPI0034A11104
MLSLITVNYNCSNVIEKLLHSIASIMPARSELIEFIVVDNFYSKDEYLRVKELECSYSFLRVIESKDNVGFAKANNMGASQAKNDYILFINPDCILNGNVFEEIQTIIKQGNETPFFFPLTDVNGNNVLFEFRFPFLSHFLKKSDWRWYTGANLLINKATFNTVGKWPEDYFMYSEDTDLHYNILLKGIKINIAKSKIIHIGNASASTVWNPLSRERRVFNSMMRFAVKHHKKTDFLIYYILVTCSFLFKRPSYAYLRIKAMIGIKE